MNSYLFVNRLSGHYSPQKFQRILYQLSEHSITPEVFQVQTPSDIFIHCAAINSRCEQPLVIVAGGDGTFNAVVNGLDPGTATLAVLPFGTSNVLAAEIGITSIEDGLKRILVGNTRSLSVGVLEFEGKSLRFVLMAGIGLDGAVVRDVWPLVKKLLKQGAYALSALKSAMVWDDKMFELNTPGGDVTCHSVIICNASRYGGNFILSPECSPFTPGFSAVCIIGNNRRTYLSCALDLFRGNVGSNNNLVRRNASTFDILGKQPIQIDGDFIGYGPARVTELSDFARMVV